MTASLNSRVLLFVAFTWLLSSCQWLGDNPDDKVIDISEEFLIYVTEGFTEEGRNLQVKIKTINPRCEEAMIELNTSQSSAFLDILVKKIVEPDSCQGDDITLYQTADFDVIDGRRYFINISLRDIIDNNGSIEIFDDMIVTTIQQQEGIRIEPAETQRLPENTIWGYARSYEVDYTGRTIDFITDLSLMSQSIVLQEGQYSGFYIDETGKLTFDGRFSSVSDANFFYKYTGDEQSLQDLLDEYRMEAGQRAEFRIYSTNGKVY